MQRLLIAVFLLFVSNAAVGQNFSNANLDGNYSVQLGNPELVSWSKTFTCTDENKTVTYAPTGTATIQNVSYGVVNFDGNGNSTVTFTEVGQLNSAASAATMNVTWDNLCNIVSVNLGYVVYKAPITKTQSGTYSVQSNGSGTLISGGTTLNFLLAGTNSNGISTTVLMTSKPLSGTSINTGLAVLQ